MPAREQLRSQLFGSGQGQNAQPCLRHVVCAQGAFEGLATNHGLQINGDVREIGPESGRDSNGVVCPVLRLTLLQHANQE